MGRKVLWVVGGMLIVGLLLIAAFSVGMYVGTHGWTRDGLALRGPESRANQSIQESPRGAQNASQLPVGRRPDAGGNAGGRGAVCPRPGTRLAGRDLWLPQRRRPGAGR